MTRRNKNGIPILDDPKENRLKERVQCLPDKHRWESNGSALEPDRLVRSSYCVKCGETITWTEFFDEEY